MGQGWRGVLTAVHGLVRAGRPITSEALATRVGFAGTARSSPTQIASGYLGTFCRWGYCKRMGSMKGAARWVRLYELTRWGKRFKV